MMLIMSVGRDCVFELLPPTGLFFIPQVTYEYGEPWWNYMDRKKLIRLPELYQSNQQSSSSKAAGTGEGNNEFGHTKYVCSYLGRHFLTCRKILRHEADVFISLRRKACCEYLSPLKVHLRRQIWTRESWAQ
jgi:hypothetical protein